MRRCKYGRRKGSKRCRKTPKRSSGRKAGKRRCRFGVVKRGKRKGQCLKTRRRRA